MPQSKPLNLSAPAQQTSPPKKNTVDYIPSKISYETAIPVSIFDDRSDFLEKCKPYDIIDGPNPLDDVPDDAPQLIASSALEAVKAEAASARSSRKRSRSPLKGAAAKSNAVKAESGEDGQSDGPKASSSHFTRPSRRGWAAEQLRDGRPYQLLQSRDMETKVRYVLDDCDYEWCAAHDFAPDVVQRGITYLEWAYVSSLLTAATPHVEDSVVEALTGARENDTLTGASASASGALRSSHNSNGGHGVLTGHVGLFSAHNSLSGSSGSADVAASGRNGGRARRQGAQGRGAESPMVSASTCALCSKSVYLLPQQDADASGAHEGSGATGGSARSANRGGRSGGRGRDGQSRGTSSNAVRGSASAHRGDSASVASSSAFPAHDLQHQGLRCSECGVVAHLRCWFLTEAPRLPEAWRCDGCTNYAQHRKRSAGVCCMCGRMGGVLLPYVSSAAARDDGESGHAGNSSDPSSPLLSHANGGSSASLVAASDMVCHAVCALTMSELAIHLRPTVIRRNGSVDMEERPYVYALRRVGKQKYAMHCVFCEHGGTGRCVQCHHPHCFEAMHASCAAEAHTVDCHTDSASSPSTIAPSRATKIEGGESSPTTTTATGVHRVLPASDFSLAAGTLATGWSGCSTYCRKHYGYSVSNAVGSAALGDKAEADALALDLTGLLTGEDGVTSPVVQKRGRGRPPVALVQQREAERRLIHQLHAYWRERREQRRRSSGQIVGEVNARLRPVVAAMLRPEIVKVSADKVRLSHFLSLVPEWQWQLVAFVEGELPLPDEEYDDVQKYRKVAHTRRSGNTRGLYDRMCLASTQLDLVCRIAAAMKQQCRLRRTSAELELETLRRLCGWK